MRIALATMVFVVGCGKSAPDDPLVYAGAFQIPVPLEWRNVTDDQIQAGAVAIQTYGKDKPKVTMIITPLPEPLVKDPSDPANCKAHADTLTIAVDSATVIDLPAGKACAVEAHKDTLLASQIVLKVGDHGVMANCSYRGGPTEKKMCDAVFKRIVPRK